MRTAEHMEHRNLERKWRPSFALGPHLTEGRSIDERRRLSWLFFFLLLWLHGRGKSKNCLCPPTLGAARLHCPRSLKSKAGWFDETASRLTTLTALRKINVFFFSFACVSTRRVSQRSSSRLPRTWILTRSCRPAVVKDSKANELVLYSNRNRVCSVCVGSGREG